MTETQEFKEEAKIKNVSIHLSQIILRLSGMFCSTRFGDDLYYLRRIVQILISELGEDYVRTELKKEGKDWDKIKIRLEILGRKIDKTKRLYDKIYDRTFSKKTEELQNKKEFFKSTRRIPLLDNDLIDMFVFLIRRTNLNKQTIRADAFKILEHSGYKTIDMTKGKTVPTEKKEEEKKE